MYNNIYYDLCEVVWCKCGWWYVRKGDLCKDVEMRLVMNGVFFLVRGSE